jgi:hypothetical protein
MKLFMIPQTVPNRPTKGAVAPMVARTPVPRLMRRLQRRLEPFQPGVDALLQTIFVGDPLAQAEFCDRFPAKARRRLFKVGKFGVSQSLNGVERGKRGPGLPARFHEFDCLGEPHRPGDDRSGPIMTAFTTTSSLMNIPHGDRSRGRTAIASTGAFGSCAQAMYGVQAQAIARTARQASKCF